MSFIDKFKKKNEGIPESKKATPVKKVAVEPAKKSEETTVAPKKGTKTGPAYKVLFSPLVSEKAAVGESLSIYTFKVNPEATKVDIKNAVKQIYGVMPTKVRIINVNAKIVTRGRTSGRRRDWKKAMVTLKKNEKIDIHEGV